MMHVVKKKGTIVSAYRLGANHPVLEELCREGKLLPRQDGTWEVFSREVLASGCGRGEIARNGDYIKLDSSGTPYPNPADFFARNHRHLEGDRYEQLPRILAAWTVQEPMCEEIRFLMEHKQLTISPDTPERYFTAPLWGTVESAARDAVILFYSITRNLDGSVRDADFNFVVRSEFDKTYDVIG